MLMFCLIHTKCELAKKSVNFCLGYYFNKVGQKESDKSKKNEIYHIPNHWLNNVFIAI